MNFSHSRLTDWGLRHVEIGKRFTILDVGCGGGRTIEKMAALATEGEVCGVDYAAGGVAASRAKNARAIGAGRVDIRQASVAALPFPDGRFDLVTAVETHYYWPDLPRSMKEVRRVLKPGAPFAIIAESYKGGRFGALQALVMAPLGSAHLSADEHRDLFANAGFTEVQVFEEPRRGWICATGRKPA